MCTEERGSCNEVLTSQNPGTKTKSQARECVNGRQKNFSGHEPGAVGCGSSKSSPSIGVLQSLDQSFATRLGRDMGVTLSKSRTQQPRPWVGSKAPRQRLTGGTHQLASGSNRSHLPQRHRRHGRNLKEQENSYLRQTPIPPQRRQPVNLERAAVTVFSNQGFTEQCAGGARSSSNTETKETVMESGRVEQRVSWEESWLCWPVLVSFATCLGFLWYLLRGHVRMTIRGCCRQGS